MLVSAVVFFGLTRTDAGRSGLRNQLEAQFDARFAGTLDIGHLRGDLINSVYASDVKLHTPDGTVVATVDSVVARPQWWNLLGGTVSLRRLSLIQPQFDLRRDTSGLWNVQTALQRIQSGSGDGLDWTLVDIAIRNGTVTTQNDGSAPVSAQRGWVFDYSNAQMRDVSLDASVEWTASERQIGLQRLSAALDEPSLALIDASGQLVFDDGTWTLPGIAVETDRSRLRVSGEYAPGPPRGSPEIDVRVTDSRLDFDELAPLSPRLPLADAVTVSGHVYGETSELVVDAIAVERGRSRIEVSGTAFGLPDSLDFETNLQASRLMAGDVRAVWPDAPRKRLNALTPLTADAVADGVVHWRAAAPLSVAVEGTVEATSAAGIIDGAFNVDRAAAQPVQYDMLVSADSLDIGALALRPELRSRLQGRIRLSGQGLAASTAVAETEVNLRPSRIAGQQLASGRARITLDAGTVDGMIVAEQAGGGRVEAQVDMATTAEQPRYTLSLSTTAFDLAPLPGALPSTSLNAQLALNGEGGSWPALSGSMELRVDASEVHGQDSTRAIPPFTTSIQVVQKGSPGPRLTIDGDVATVRVDGTVAVRPLLALGRLWSTALADAARQAVDKPAPSPIASAGPAPSASPPTPVDLEPLRAQARDALATTGFRDTLGLRGSLRIHRSDVLRAWWPRFPRLPDSLETEVRLTAGPDTLALQGALATPRAGLQTTSLDQVRIVTRLSGALGAPLVETLSAEVDVYADSVRTGPVSLQEVGLNVQYADRRGGLRMEGRGTDTLGEVLLDAGLAVRPDRNAITIDTLRATVGSQAWTNAGTGRLDAYRDALHVEPFVVESPRLFADGTQQVRVRGAVSEASSDTLFVDSRDVSLYPLSQIAGLRPLGGLLTGTTALTGIGSAFQARSTAEIQRLSFDRRLLGRLNLSTTYRPGSGDLRLDAALSPEPVPFDTLQARGAALVPNGVRRSEPNQLRLRGRIRTDPAAAPDDADVLDLRLDVTRADLFFFEYIFESEIARVRGFTAGSAHIGGSWTDPVFDADMRVADGQFDLPRFGLRYQIEGGVRVDREGFKLSDVRVSDDDGSATLDGGILFNDYQFFSFDLRGRLDELKIVGVNRSQDLPFYGDIRVSGPATLTGPLSNAQLTSNDIRATPDSELFIPVSEGELEDDTGFILFADSTGRVPDLQDLTRRGNILDERPQGEPTFVEGLEFDVNITAPEGSTVHLVFDPLVGDVVTAQGAGRIQFQRQEGEFFVYGTFQVSGGNYQFTAGEVFVRRFNIEDGSITWEGDPINASLDLDASYRTRASPAGLPGFEDRGGRIPLIVQLDITGDVEAPQVDLSLSRARDERTQLVGSQTLDAILNQPELATEYATSVLLTNTFLLTTSTLTQRNAGDENRIAEAGNQLAFNSVSQLVASQLNRYLNEALPNLNVNFGIQGEDPQDLDVIYGVALRLLDERLIIRGEGVYTGDDPEEAEAQGPEGEFTVEVRLSSRVSVEAFVRRRGDDLTQGQTLTRSAGAGLSYRTEFTTWKRLFYRLFGWFLPDPSDPPDDETEDLPAAGDMVIRPSEDAPSDEKAPQ
jgi:hypothetical protein